MIVAQVLAILVVSLQCYASLSRLPIGNLALPTRGSVRDIKANCWTCSPGWAHWYDFGMSAPGNGDPCQCIRGTPSQITTKPPTYTTTTKSPATTVKPTPYCWTCPSGYAHWFDLGLPEPADKCACAPISSGQTTKAPTVTTTPPGATTKAPSSTPNCWTCSPGYLHWYELGLPEPADKCACAPITSGQTTKAPSVTTTTRAPSVTTTRAPISTPYCWTCPAGYLHWYELGLPEPTDKCACVPISSGTTTRAPSVTTTTRAPTPTTSSPTPYCWTCPAGYTHWFNLGMSSAPGGDQCACVKGTSITPTAAPQGGGGSPTSPPSSLMQKFKNAMTPSASSPGSTSFSACVAPYSPWNPPPADLVKQVLNKLVTTTNYRTIMVYSLDQWIAGFAQAAGVKVLGIIYMTADWNSNANNIALGVTAAKMYPDTVVAVSCGNEAGMNLGATSSTAAIIQNCVTQVRQQGVKQPVGSIDVPGSWVQNGNPWTAASQGLDWIGVNYYPWFDNMYGSPPLSCANPSNVGQKTLAGFNAIQAKFPNQPIFLTEAGWPTSPSGSSVNAPGNVNNGQVCATAGSAEQKTGVQNIVDAFRAAGKPINMFSSFREAWKGSSSTSFEEYWGFCSGSYPFNCDNAPR